MPKIKNIATETAVKSTTSVKVGVALLFLGVATIAASFVGIFSRSSYSTLGFANPDLTIPKITFEQSVGLQKINIYYQNIGKGPVTKPFSVYVQVDPEIKKTFNKKCFCVVNKDGSWTPYNEIGPGLYEIPVKEYKMNPKAFGILEIVIPFMEDKDVLSEKFSVRAFVNRTQTLIESSYQNNYKAEVFSPKDLWDKIQNLSGDPGYGYGYYPPVPGSYGYGYYPPVPGSYGYGYGWVPFISNVSIYKESLPSNQLTNGEGVWGKFTVVADQNSDIQIKSIVLKVVGNMNVPQVVEKLEIIDEYGVVLGQISNGSFINDFKNLNYVIQKGTTKTLSVRGTGAGFVENDTLGVIVDSLVYEDLKNKVPFILEQDVNLGLLIF
ncbi:MAG: hypothetical protein ABII02_02030 [Candidatus Magasanikbacteria bacterium]